MILLFISMNESKKKNRQIKHTRLNAFEFRNNFCIDVLDQFNNKQHRQKQRKKIRNNKNI